MLRLCLRRGFTRVEFINSRRGSNRRKQVPPIYFTNYCPHLKNVHTTTLLCEREHETKISKTLESLQDTDKKVATIVPKRSIFRRIKDEILHYYHGFKLLFIDIGVSVKLLWQVLHGVTLTRREHRLLVRTTSDCFRLLPFSVFIIVPFMELLLPVFLKLFPGMLPSTFTTSDKRQDNMKAALKVKLDMAKFLQKTLDEMAVTTKGRHSQSAKEFAEFFEKIRTSGGEVASEDIIKYSKLFEDEVTLDSLLNSQLKALCRVLEIQPLLTSASIRLQLRMKLKSLAADDKVIEAEGIESLNIDELQQVCKARGMRAVGVDDNRLRRQLKQWLELSKANVPPSLLLLTRAMYLPENLPPAEKLQRTLSALPDVAALQARANIAELEGKIDNKTRLEIVREERRKIEEERRELERLEKESQQAEAKKGIKLEKRVEPAVPIGDLYYQLEFESSPMPQLENTLEVGRPPETTSVVDVINKRLTRNVPHPAVPKDKLTTDDLEVLETALENLAELKENKKLLVEKEELEDLLSNVKEYKSDLQGLQAVADKDRVLVKAKGAQHLLTNLNTFLSHIDNDVKKIDCTAIPDIKEKLSLTAEVSVEELLEACEKVITDPVRLERIRDLISKIDADQDGKCSKQEVLEVIELISNERESLTAEQAGDIFGLVSKQQDYIKKYKP